jgi:hypothetical protein
MSIPFVQTERPETWVKIASKTIFFHRKGTSLTFQKKRQSRTSRVTMRTIRSYRPVLHILRQSDQVRNDRPLFLLHLADQYQLLMQKHVRLCAFTETFLKTSLPTSNKPTFSVGRRVHERGTVSEICVHGVSSSYSDSSGMCLRILYIYREAYGVSVADYHYVNGSCPNLPFFPLEIFKKLIGFMNCLNFKRF